MRTCSKCHKSKPLTKEFYHSDIKGREGFAAACKLCRNKAKRKSPEAKFLEKANEIVNVPIESDDIFTQLSQKIGRMYSIRVEKDGKTELRVYGNPSQQFYGESSGEVVDMVLCQ